MTNAVEKFVTGTVENTVTNMVNKTATNMLGRKPRVASPRCRRSAGMMRTREASTWRMLTSGSRATTSRLCQLCARLRCFRRSERGNHIPDAVGSDG